MFGAWLLLSLLCGLFLRCDCLLCYNCELSEKNNTRCNENQPQLCTMEQGCETFRDGNLLRKSCTLGCSRGDGASNEKCDICDRDLCNSYEYGHGVMPPSPPNANQKQSLGMTTFSLYTQPTTFWEAQDYCLRNGETLVNINDVKVQEFLEATHDVALIGESTIKGFWMGAIAADGNDWIWSDTGMAIQPPPVGGYVCSNQGNFSHQNWLPNHPLNATKGRNFCGVVMLTKSFQWMSVSCGEKVASFLCQRRQNAVDNSKPTYIQSTIHKDQVYTYYSEHNDATTAHQACLNSGSQLAMLHSQAVKNSVSQKLAFAISDDYWSAQQCAKEENGAEINTLRSFPIYPCSTKLPFMCQKLFRPATPETCYTTRKPTTQASTTIVTSQTTTIQSTEAIVSTSTAENIPLDAKMSPTTHPYNPELRLDQFVCAGTTIYGKVPVTFNDTRANTWSFSKEKCPTGVPLASVYCDVWSLQFNISSLTFEDCRRTIHDVKTELALDVKSESVDLEKYSSTACVMTSGKNLDDHQVQDAIDVLVLLDKQLKPKDHLEMEKEVPKVTTKVLSDVITSVDNIYNNLNGNDVSNNIKVDLQMVVEDFASNLVINSTQPVYKLHTNNIDVQVVELTSNKTSNEAFLHTFVPITNKNQTSISIDNHKPVGAKKAYFVSYKNSTLFPSTQQVKEVITATVLDENNKEVNVAVTFSFQRNNKSNNCLIETCSFYDTLNQTWSTHGCKHLHGITNDDDVITCVCNHTTSFGVVVSLRDDHIDVALDIASEVGLGICVFFLLLTIILFLKLPELRRVRSAKIHVNLCLCLALTYLTFLVGVNQTSPRELCVAIAAFIHYFLLAAWGWMAVESITMYRMFVTSMDRPKMTEFWKMALSVYSIAALVVGATLIGAWATNSNTGSYNEDCVYQDMWSNYVGDRYCWLTGVALYSFVAIVGFLLLVNVVLAFLVIKAITWGRRKVQSSTEETPAIHVLRAVLVAVLMGLSWIFAVPIVVSQDHVVQLVFGWFFAISTSLQGLFVFYFFCLRREDVRAAWVDPLIHALCANSRKQHPEATKGAHHGAAHNDSNVGMTSSRSWRRFTSSQRVTNTTTTG